MTTSREQLRQWLEAPEGARLEFKEARRNYHFEKLLRYCVALANEGGGQILLGVSDRAQVIGLREQGGGLPQAGPGGLGQQAMTTQKRANRGSNRCPTTIRIASNMNHLSIVCVSEVPIRPDRAERKH